MALEESRRQTEEMILNRVEAEYERQRSLVSEGIEAERLRNRDRVEGERLLIKERLEAERLLMNAKTTLGSTSNSSTLSLFCHHSVLFAVCNQVFL